MVERLILVGGGEHAAVVADAVSAAGSGHLLGYVDEAPTAAMTRYGMPYLGTDDAVAGHRPHAVLAVGTTGPSTIRREIVARLDPVIGGWLTVVHPAAVVSPRASIGPGTVVMAGAVIETGAVIGAHCIVNTGAVLCHDVGMDDYAVVAPGAVAGGAVTLGVGSFVGLGALIRDHCTVGPEAVVAMGAVVVSDVAPGSVVAGVPAVPIAR